MKKIQFNGKLNLNKSTVTKLNEEQQNGVVGGKEDRTATGPGVCTARPTLFCCRPTVGKKCDDTKTGPGVCTAMPTLFCC